VLTLFVVPNSDAYLLSRYPDEFPEYLGKLFVQSLETRRKEEQKKCRLPLRGDMSQMLRLHTGGIRRQTR
jgi:hypothetical protein